MTSERALLLPPPSQPSGSLEAPIPDGTDPLNLTRANRAGILAGIWIANFIASLNTTLVATLITSISSEFDAANQASWLGSSFLLATATFTPLYGRLSNILGRKGANQLAVIFLFIGTVICGVARSMNWLIAGRFIAGCGGGGVFTTSSIITSDLYSMRARGLTQGVASIFGGLGMGLGGPFGGWVSERYGWRMAFLMQLPLFFISFTFTQRCLRYKVYAKLRTPLEIVLRIDWLGSLFLLLGVGCTLFGLAFRYNSDYPWSSAYVWATFSGAFVSAVAFVAVELLIAPEPVLAPQLLRMRVAVLVSLSSLFVPMANFCVMYFFPMFFELVAGQSATEAGLHLTPNSISMSFGSLLAGYVMHRTGRYKTLNLVCGILPFIAIVFIVFITPESSSFTQWFAIIPLGFGNAVVLQTTLIALLVSIDSSHLAVGTGFVQLFRGIGQVLGVALPSAIFQHVLERELRARFTEPGSDKLIKEIRHNSRVVLLLPPEAQVVAQEAFAISLKVVFTFAAAATLAGFIIRLGIPEQSLDTPAADDQWSESSYNSDDEALGDSDEDAASLATALGIPEPGPLPRPLATVSSPAGVSVSPRPIMRRRLSAFESDDGMDPEPSVKSFRRTLSRASSLSAGFQVGSLGRTSTFGSIRGDTVGEVEEEDEDEQYDEEHGNI